MNTPLASSADSEFLTTREVALALGLAVRSVQLMVDRGDLQAWRTHGGHRRITRTSLENWRAKGLNTLKENPTKSSSGRHAQTPARSVLLIEDSVHFQNLVKLLLDETFPDVTLHLAGDGIVGLSMAGQWQPDVLIIDILLPGMDGATLITTLRSHHQFRRSRLIVLTSLDTAQLAPYAFALSGVPVVHKSRLVLDLPPLLTTLLPVLPTPAVAV
jgi:excisionase family DNA binding protein